MKDRFVYGISASFSALADLDEINFHHQVADSDSGKV